jgi:hypothetical protein
MIQVDISPPPDRAELKSANSCEAQLLIYKASWIEQTNNLNMCNIQIRSIKEWSDDNR